MINCLLCHRHNPYEPTLWQLINFQPVETPPICIKCQQQFVSITANDACQNCGRDHSRPYCPDCIRWGTQLPFRNLALYTYNSAMKQFMSQYKFNGDYRLRRIFQTEMVTMVQRIKPDLVVPIPLTIATYDLRGYNQVTGLLAETMISPILGTIQVTKIRSQSDKTRVERLATVQPFKINPGDWRLENKHILLVDDIYTTGRTMRHAAELLLTAGASKVTGLTLAHG